MLRGALLVAWVAFIAFSVALLVREWDGSGVRPDFRDVVTHLDLELDLSAPPRLAGKARLSLREGTQGRIWLLLNRALEVERAADGTGRELEWEDEGRLRSDYHSEARVIAVDLPGPARELVLEYAGVGQDGSQKSDWMGVLLLATDELRMSPQTVFYPQIPVDIDGPGATPWPARLRLLAPADLEAYAPGRPGEWSGAPAGGRAWCWEADTPGVLSLIAARRVRGETLLGDARVITLLAAKHADLGESIAREAEEMLRFYAGVFGPIGARTLGIVEMQSRGDDSYNWTSQGIIAMESGALSAGVPAQTLAHEIAHLWWGQEVSAHGRGERFLTEGLAEFAAWRFVRSAQGEAAADELALDAEESWWRSVHETGVDPALFDVRFGTEGYSELAYAKGPMALWRLERRLGVERMDAVLRSYGERMRAAGEGVDGAGAFLAALREHGAKLELDLALLEQSGHAHTVLEDVVFDGPSARGRARIERCPEGIPAPAIARMTVAAYTETTAIRRTVPLDDERSAQFEVVAPDAIQAVRVDPDGELAGWRAPPVLRPGIGLQSSEPEDGATEVALGLLPVKLRFGARLREPAPGFAARMQKSCTAEAAAGKTTYFGVRSATLEGGGSTLVITLATEPGREHVLLVPDGLATEHGIPLPPARLRFTTRSAEGLPRPRIVTIEPADGARDVPTSLTRLEIVFSEPMRIGRGFQTTLVDELEADGWAFPPLGESRWEDPQTLIWELDAPLEEGKRYGLPFGYHYRSELGISIERVDLRFETRREGLAE